MTKFRILILNQKNIDIDTQISNKVKSVVICRTFVAYRIQNGNNNLLGDNKPVKHVTCDTERIYDLLGTNPNMI